MDKLFTYGSLMCEDIMSMVVGRTLSYCKAVLPDYLRYKIRNEQYPGVIQVSGGLVEGVVYQGIETRQWERLDRFEGDIYSRCRVLITYPAGSEDMVGCYVVKPEHRHMLTEEAWDFETFLRRGKSIFQTRFMGFKDIAQEI